MQQVQDFVTIFLQQNSLTYPTSYLEITPNNSVINFLSDLENRYNLWSTCKINYSSLVNID